MLAHGASGGTAPRFTGVAAAAVLAVLAACSPASKPPAPATTPAISDDASSHEPDACERGDATDCLRLAEALDEDGAAPGGSTKMAAYETRACELGEPWGCARLGHTYWQGRPGFPQDRPKAVALWAEACERGVASGCALAGQALRSGLDVPRDEFRARRLLAMACEAGLAESCRGAEGSGAHVLDLREARLRLHAHHAEAHWCYQRALMRDPTLAGLLALKIRIGPAGTADGIELTQDTVGDETFAECVVDVASRIDFEPPVGGQDIVVDHVFRFAPGG